jgi:hypothetical protein
MRGLSMIFAAFDFSGFGAGCAGARLIKTTAKTTAKTV